MNNKIELKFKDWLQNEMAARRLTGRLLQTATDPDRFMVVISAFRDNREVFPGATKQLEHDIRAKGFDTHKLRTPSPLGTTPTTGGYKEGDRKVEEDSITVSAPKGAELPDPKETVRFFMALAEKYQQMGVIIKLPGEKAHEYTTSFHQAGRGSRIPYGDAQRQREPRYYTRPRERDAATHGTDGVTFNPDFDKIHPDPRQQV